MCTKWSFVSSTRHKAQGWDEPGAFYCSLVHADGCAHPCDYCADPVQLLPCDCHPKPNVGNVERRLFQIWEHKHTKRASGGVRATLEKTAQELLLNPIVGRHMDSGSRVRFWNMLVDYEIV